MILHFIFFINKTAHCELKFVLNIFRHGARYSYMNPNLHLKRKYLKLNCEETFLTVSARENGTFLFYLIL